MTNSSYGYKHTHTQTNSSYGYKHTHTQTNSSYGYKHTHTHKYVSHSSLGRNCSLNFKSKSISGKVNRVLQGI